MKFIDFNKQEILANARLCENGFYEYIVGSPLEVTSIRDNHFNEVMANNLSSNVQGDKLMVRYRPTNKVYFSSSFLNSNNDDFFASCYIDEKTGSIFIGTLQEFGNMSGILVFSGYLSLNNYVEEDRPILCSERQYDTVKKKVKVLSVGVRGDKLYGLVYVPSVKGLAVSIRHNNTSGFSPNTYKVFKPKNYRGYSIKDWFDGTKVKEV